MLSIFNQKPEKEQPIIFDSEFKGIAPDPYLDENYDARQVQHRIEDADTSTQLGLGICQGAVLSGVQMVATQSLYNIGVVGLLPMVVASIPMGLALTAAITTITIDNGVSISDTGKLCSGLGRVGILALSSLKLHVDAQHTESVANRGIETLKADLIRYEKSVQTTEPSMGWEVLVLVGVVAFIGLFYKGKK